MMAQLLDATPTKLAGLVTVCATIVAVTGNINSEVYVNVLLTVLGFGFGHAIAQTANGTNGH